jgi:hypothetical protein
MLNFFAVWFESPNQQEPSPGCRARKRSVSARRDGRSLCLVGKDGHPQRWGSDSAPTKGREVSLRLATGRESQGLVFGECLKGGEGGNDRRAREDERESLRASERGLARNGTDCQVELKSGESVKRKGKVMMLIAVEVKDQRSVKRSCSSQCDYRHAGGGSGDVRRDITGVRNGYG